MRDIDEMEMPKERAITNTHPELGLGLFSFLSTPQIWKELKREEQEVKSLVKKKVSQAHSVHVFFWVPPANHQHRCISILSTSY